MVVGSAGIFIDDHTMMMYVQMCVIIRVSTDVLWPHYGIRKCQTAALLLVPDIPLTDKKKKKKTKKKFTTCFTFNQLLYN